VSVKAALADNRPTWHNPKVLSLLLLVFLTGFVGGVLAIKLYSGVTSSRAASPAWNTGGRELTLQRLQKDLDLTPDQAAKVETELDDFVMYYQGLQGQMDDWRLEGKKRIMRILTPEQQKKFERIMQDQR
jgi:Spy/CpxP family protein refolding chaperone